MDTLQIPHSEAIKGEVVTTFKENDGIGLGYLVGDEVFVTTGSYWAKNAKHDVFPMVDYKCDHGQAYYKRMMNHDLDW